jgi:hypothetical protein
MEKAQAGQQDMRDDEGPREHNNGRTTHANRDVGDVRQAQMQRRYVVREVTSYQASWTEMERGEEGRFTLQLILDNGVEEYTLELADDDIDVLLKLLKRSKHTTFDLERNVLMFANIEA